MFYLLTGGYTLDPKIALVDDDSSPRKGIFCFAWNPDTEEITRKFVCREAGDPTWLEPIPGKPVLYTVCEVEKNGCKGSVVRAYRIDPDDNALSLIGSQMAGGTDACHLMISPNRRYLLCANYSSGSLSVLPIQEDYSPGPVRWLRGHTGKSVNPERQESAHVHQAFLAPDKKHVYVSDLGLDKLVCYEADWENGYLYKSEWPDIPAIPGQGPRHAVFGPGADRLYQVTEMACEVNVYEYDICSGAARLMQTVSLMEEGAPARLSSGAAIRIHPDGKWLYASVRGTFSDHDRIVAFTIERDGSLKKVQSVYSGGKTPRDFTISPDGRHLFCGNVDSGVLSVFRINEADGTLNEILRENEVGVMSLCFVS